MRNKSKMVNIPQCEILISTKAISAIEQFSSAGLNQETGGIVGGKGSFEDGKIIITNVSECGPNSIKKVNFFSRDTVFCQKILDEWAKASLREVDYLGEWHKHFEINPKPSFQDILTLRHISRSKNYHVSIPILLIIGNSNLRSSLNIFAVNSKGEFKFMEWHNNPPE